MNNHSGEAPSLETGISFGTLELRIARDDDEIRAAQRLRYRVFYEEMNAIPTAAIAAERRDIDDFDSVCDHLIVLDKKRTGDNAIIGTYRLLLRSVALRHGEFYTAQEFNISNLLAVDGELVELGRSCVDTRFRRGAVVQFLLRGLGAYVEQHDIQVMFGCASLPGTDPAQVELPLSYLANYVAAPDRLRPRALDHLYEEMRRLPVEAFDEGEGLASLPPLIRGYVRAGCRFGDGAVIDHQFNTIDVCTMLDVSEVTNRYGRRYRPQN